MLEKHYQTTVDLVVWDYFLSKPEECFEKGTAI